MRIFLSRSIPIFSSLISGNSATMRKYRLSSVRWTTGSITFLIRRVRVRHHLNIINSVAATPAILSAAWCFLPGCFRLIDPERTPGRKRGTGDRGKEKVRSPQSFPAEFPVDRKVGVSDLFFLSHFPGDLPERSCQRLIPQLLSSVPVPPELSTGPQWSSGTVVCEVPFPGLHCNGLLHPRKCMYRK